MLAVTFTQTRGREHIIKGVRAPWGAGSLFSPRWVFLSLLSLFYCTSIDLVSRKANTFFFFLRIEEDWEASGLEKDPQKAVVLSPVGFTPGPTPGLGIRILGRGLPSRRGPSSEPFRLCHAARKAAWRPDEALRYGHGLGFQAAVPFTS